jgi:hypothetical protein
LLTASLASAEAVREASLNIKAIPFPITPTVFTVLSSASAEALFENRALALGSAPEAGPEDKSAQEPVKAPVKDPAP